MTKIFYEQAENEIGMFLWFRIYKDKKLFEPGQIFEEDGIKYAVISHKLVEENIKGKYNLIKLIVKRRFDDKKGIS